MLELRYRVRWQVAGILLLLLALSASMLPEIPFWPDNAQAPFEFSDKALHVIAFMFLTVWFSGQYARTGYWRLALGLLAFGALIEVLQGMTNYRSAEWLDLYADGVGIALGLLMALLGLGGWSQRIEQRWLR